nr:hypothetical protein [Tanacetum cinerariifolium]
GREQTSSQYQYILQSGDLESLRLWYPKVVTALKSLKELTAIDAHDGGGTQQVTLIVDRDAAKRLGIDMDMVTTVLNNAYSQRQVQVITADGARVPLSTIAHYERSLEDDRVNHDGQFASDNISFDLADGVTLDQATAAIEQEPAVDDPRGVGGGLPGPWHSLRELCPPADDSVDAALGGRRGIAEHLPHRRTVQPDLAVGTVSIDRRGEKERHSDDRSGPATGARQWHVATGIHPQCLSAASSADSDDHAGGDPGCRAVAAEQCRGRGNAPPAGPDHHRWIDPQPDSDAVHHTCGLPLSRPFASSCQ